MAGVSVGQILPPFVEVIFPGFLSDGTATYVIVIFSMLVQGTSFGRVLGRAMPAMSEMPVRKWETPRNAPFSSIPRLPVAVNRMLLELPGSGPGGSRAPRDRTAHICLPYSRRSKMLFDRLFWVDRRERTNFPFSVPVRAELTCHRCKE